MNVFVSNLLVLYPIAFSLFVALRLAEATTDGRKVTFGVQVVRSMMFVLFAFSLIGIACRSTILSILWVFLFSLTAVVVLIKQSRLNRSVITMTVLGCRDLPQIQRAVVYASEEHSGGLGRRLKGMSKLLLNNVPWSRALERSGFCRGSYERLAARLAERFGGSLSDGDGEGVDGRLRIENDLERMLSRLSLLAWVSLFAPVFAFYKYRVIPIMVRMLEEFELPIPSAMVILQGDFYLGWISGAVVTLVMLAILLAALVWFFPRLTLLWPLRWLSRTYYRCLGFVAFSRVSEHVPNLIAACHETAALVPAGHIASQFRGAAMRLERGESPVMALAGAGLVQRERLGDFESILSTSGLSWATQQLANSEVERMLNRYSLLIQFLLVVFTLVFAALVGLVAVAMFQVLSGMVESLAVT
jgi:hypothetical protein